jgi:hypothetical protein
MIKQKISHFLILAMFILLTACNTTSQIENLPSMTFTHLPHIRLKVKNIEVNSKFQYDTNTSHIAHKFPISPEKAIITWAQDRLLIAGINNIARLTIIQADAQEIKLKIDKSFTGAFKNQQSARYQTFVKVSLEIFDENKIQQGIVIGEAEHSITVSEATPLSDRRKIWYNLIEKLMAKFDSAMQKSINNNLRSYVN